MARKKLVAGNWKMNTTLAEAKALASAVVAGQASGPDVGVVVCPPYPWLLPVAEVVAGSRVDLGAQDCANQEKPGAFTGQMLPAMLVEAGCRYVIVGHSERRHGLGEGVDLLRGKVRYGLNAGLSVIFCVGETQEERDAGKTNAVLEQQLQSLNGPDASKYGRLVVAYEPVWAIGTGKVATPDDVQAAHAFLRSRIAANPAYGGENVASALPILYGGSVNAGNAATLMALPDVDGALVGGASLKADSFLAIVNAAGV